MKPDVLVVPNQVTARGILVVFVSHGNSPSKQENWWTMHIPLQIDTSVLLTSGWEAIAKKKRQKQQQQTIIKLLNNMSQLHI